MIVKEAHIEIAMDILSVGKGDLKLTWDPTDPEDVAKARTTITKMLKSGYSIFVETDDGPSRVKSFSPTTMSYIITEVADGTELPSGPKEPAALPPGSPAAKRGPGRPKGSTNKRTKDKEVPVAGSRSTAVGRTAGG